MKQLLIILLTSITLLSSQVYNCTKHFDGVIVDNTITWNSTEEIENNKLTIDKSIVTIENGKYDFTIIELISSIDNELIYYSKDWENLNCYIIIEDYDEFKYIYFQYSNIIYGYKITKL